MAELYFNYNRIPYLFDSKQLKLYRLIESNRIEIKNSETLSNVRLSSIEINRERAFSLALESKK
jgi:hypothetical protein